MLAFHRARCELQLGDHPIPERRPGEALVRVRMAGICNTDLEIARGYMDFAGILGHEFVGEVALTFNAAPLVIDEITLVGSRCGPFDPAIASLAAREVQPDSLIDSVFSLANAQQAFEKAAAPGVLKVLLEMPGRG